VCTLIVSVMPESPLPVLLAAVRDEFVTRPWMSPARHWPEHPGLIGGRDLQAGGTWFAADPRHRRAAAVLNGRGALAPQGIRRSRGELPLLAAAEGGWPRVDPRAYDPFHLVLAGLDGVRLWSWDGRRVTEDKLPDGVHVLVNSGWARGHGDPRASWLRDRFAAAARPVWRAEASPARFWGEWLDLASGAGLPPDDPRSLLIRRTVGGRVFASLSVTLVGLGEEGVRYDFCPCPEDPGSWHQVRATG
jgi:uncharacterized protein with NRDE domain